jgi:NADP-dependent 3-hydroxy acid dehydrogenase YdfG
MSEICLKYPFFLFLYIRVAGASAGIGAAAAELFAKYGARLALTGRNMERLAQVKQRCVEKGLKEANVST